MLNDGAVPLIEGGKVENKYSLVYDAALILLIVSFIYSGSKKGFLKMVLSLAVYVISFAFSSAMSDKLSESVYMKYVRPKVISAASDYSESLRDKILDEVNIQNVLPNDSNYSEINISEYIPEIEKIIEDNIKDSMSEILDKYNTDDETDITYDDDFKQTVIDGVIGDDTEKIAEYIEKNFIRQSVVRGIGYLLWSVTFTITMAVGKTIIRIVLSVRQVGVIKRFDNTLGGILGFIQSILIVYAIVIFIKLIIGLTGNIGIISEETIADTVIFKYLYNFVSL